MPIFDIVLGRWNSGPLEFFITLLMPFLVLAGLRLICVRRRIRLPPLFYPLAMICAMASILYAPVCGCTGIEQVQGAVIIACLMCAIFFGPVILAYLLFSRWRSA